MGAVYKSGVGKGCGGGWGWEQWTNQVLVMGVGGWGVYKFGVGKGHSVQIICW